MRRDWDRYFLDIAAVVASRATCPRKSVGAVIVRDRRILASGYNGSLPGRPHCTDVGCDMVDGHCVRVTHAEVNAVTQCAIYGIETRGATMYSTLLPCWPCFRTCATSGIERFCYAEDYRANPRVTDGAAALGIEIVRLEG